jgi:N-acetylmuramoyl-L-alanine amidase
MGLDLEMGDEELRMKHADQAGRRRILKTGLGACLVLPKWLGTVSALCAAPDVLKIIDRISPRNGHRPLRPRTLYIVLHTTEGAEAGALDKVWRRGETHYFVATDGRVLRIIDPAKIAAHAGRSMWEGHRNIDNFSIGIEVVGTYDRDITAAQYSSLNALLAQLKSRYGIADRNVLTHSMVAYGSPNRFHDKDHRGRKRCGMIFARADVRRKLGLMDKPGHDADVEAGRLVVADEELYRFLFAPAPSGSEHRAQPIEIAVPIPTDSNIVTSKWTPWNIARERYDRPETTYVFPDGKRVRGDQVKDWNRIPEGTRVLLAEGQTENEPAVEGFLEIGKDGDNPRSLVGDAYDRSTTIYFFPDGRVRTGHDLKNTKAGAALLDHLPVGTRLLAGYVYGGFVQSRRPASSIAGIKWNYPSTYYRFPDGRIVSGDEINDASIPTNTLIFYQN